MKVLMVGPARDVHGGVSAVVNSYYEAGLDKKVELEYLSSMRDGSKLQKLWVAISAYIQFVFCVWKYDIVHIHMASDASFYRKALFVLLTKLYRKKLIIHQHGGSFQDFYYGTKNNAKQRLICKILNCADCFIVLSKEWYDFFHHLVDPTIMLTMNNAIAVPKVENKEYENHNILYLGRVTKEKGIRELVTAFERVRKTYADSVLYLGGVFEEEAFSDEIIGRENIRFLGWIGDSQKAKALEECSVFVLPSYFEGQPMSLLEAMGYGCCCISTEVGGIPQIIKHNYNGILIEAQNDIMLTDAILSVIDNTELKKQLGMEAKNTICQKYDIQMRINQLLEIYKSL